MKDVPLHLKCTWSDDDLLPLIAYRKAQSAVISSPDAGKDEIRWAKKNIKAATLVLQYIQGEGVFAKSVRPNDFPDELEHNIGFACLYLGATPERVGSANDDNSNNRRLT